MVKTFLNTKTKKVLLVTYNPLVEVSETLDLFYGYPDPEISLLNYMDAIHRMSGRTYRYEIVQHEMIHEPAPMAGDFIYLPQHLIETIDRKRDPNPALFDYQRLIQGFDVCAKVMARDIDEVWVMSHPHSNLSEAVMGGPSAFWLCNPPLLNTEHALRRFPVMGFDMSQDEGAMLEAFLHRAEATMYEVYKMHPPKLNAWSKFISAEGVGSAHRPPNGLYDHDFKNNRYVLSSCDDWYNYPHLQGKVKTVNHTEWGYGSRIKHHEWWLDHLPRATGKTDGAFNNWWHYIMTPDWVNNSN